MGGLARILNKILPCLYPETTQAYVTPNTVYSYPATSLREPSASGSKIHQGQLDSQRSFTPHPATHGGSPVQALARRSARCRRTGYSRQEYHDQDMLAVSINKELPPIPTMSPQSPTPPGPSTELNTATMNMPGLVYDNPAITQDVEVTGNLATYTTQNRSTLGFSRNTSQFSLNYPQAVENNGWLEEHRDLDPNVLERMRITHVIEGTMFNSYDRDDPPQCYPHTRTRFLEELHSYIYSGTRLIWLVGLAGSGKSAVVQSLAENLSLSSTCATIFFSRLNNRNDSRKIFTTIAYHLAIVDQNYHRFLAEKLMTEPGFLTKSLEQQFKELFIIPFLNDHVIAHNHPWVVIIDGIDECNSKTDQCRALDLIRDSLLHHSNATPFVWIVSSRPEIHLKVPFSRIEARVRDFCRMEVPIGTNEASKSVEIYFRDRFARIRQDYAHKLPPHWPSEADVVKLAVASWGLFIFASTLADYIAEEDPVGRLEQINNLIEKDDKRFTGSRERTRNNPFKLLDVLYTLIMSNIPLDLLPLTKSILGFSLLGKPMFQTSSMASKSGDETNFNATCLLDVGNILSLKQNTAYSSLSNLYSLLIIPPPERAYKESVRIRHISFSEFLVDKYRSGAYHVSLDDELLTIWRGYCRITKQATYPPGRVTLSWKLLHSSSSDVEYKRQLVRRARLKWLELLIKHCHDNNSCNCALPVYLSPNTSETIKALHGLSPRITDIPHNLGSISKIYYWFSRLHAPIPVRTHVVVRQFALGLLDESDVDAMFRGLLMRGWGCYAQNNHMDLTGLSYSEWSRLKELALTGEDDLPWRDHWDSEAKVTWGVLGELLRAKVTATALFDNITVMIMQLRPSEYFAVIGPCRDYPPFEQRQISYLIFPYVESP